MKILLLGTSSAEGWPGLFCRCPACAKARALGGKNIRTRSSALIDGVLKIDFPPDTLHQLIRCNLDLLSLEALLITHGHDDHFAPAELQYRGIHFVPEPLEDRLPVYGPVDVMQTIQRTRELQDAPLELHCMEPFEAMDVAGYTVTPVLAQHDPARLCFNYLIADRSGKTLLYATDTGWYHQPTWRYLLSTRLDGIVVECTKGPHEGGYPAHLSIPDVVRMREKLIAGGALRADAPVVTTHMSHLGGLLHDEMEAALQPHGIQVGYDGMTFEL